MYLLLVTFLCITCISANLPCKISDHECTKKAAASSYSRWFEILKESLEPLHKDLIEGNFPTLNYKFLDTNTTGFSQCSVEDLKFSGDKVKDNLKFDLKMFCPRLMMKGNYELKGVLISESVVGKGPYTMECKGYTFVVNADMNTHPGPDGKEVATIKSFKVDVESAKGMQFDFKNLFNGQKELSDAVHKFANENWEAVSKAFQGPFMTANFETMIKIVNNKILKHIPLDTYIDSKV
ncbi:hypothetical protein K1T71_001363 [Dendrolimus kikuchii]|uniref:Uncharacterized protein n=1 Tax=Dendrolimus kikuchii TaxID=765133 RepID=A0ACC1DIF3_9NEOP|nr:hypothetical protein K1T71_001363 [Dendrolimus kikuchii]